MSEPTKPTAAKAKQTAQLARAEREALAVANDPILRQMLDEERVEGQEIDTRLLWRLIRRVGLHWKLAAFAILLALIEAQLMALPAWLIGLAIDEIGPAAGSRDTLPHEYRDFTFSVHAPEAFVRLRAQRCAIA